MMNQGDAFYSTAGASTSEQAAQKKSLWTMLINELSLSAEQEQKIRIQYKQQENTSNKAERRKLSVAMLYLNKLQESMNVRARAIQSHAEALQHILTPEQVESG